MFLQITSVNFNETSLQLEAQTPPNLFVGEEMRDVHVSGGDQPTTVVNTRIEKCDVYIGRGSIWGNPYSHLDNTKAIWRVATRDEAIAAYAIWIQKQPKLLELIPTLRGKKLGCYCDPLPCHGWVLAELADQGPMMTIPGIK